MKPCDDCAASPTCYVMAAEQPRVTEFTADGMWLAQMAIAKAGTFIPQHAHTHPHLTMIAVGSVRVTQNGVVTGEHSAPDGIYILADVKHTFETLTDGVVLYCVHNTHRTGEVEVSDEHQLIKDEL